jgi:hypothetical protein
MQAPPAATKETGAMGREIESRRGIPRHRNLRTLRRMSVKNGRFPL